MTDLPVLKFNVCSSTKLIIQKNLYCVTYIIITNFVRGVLFNTFAFCPQ